MIIPLNVYFKEGQEHELLKEFQQIYPMLQLIAEDMGRFCRLNGFRFVITDILSCVNEDKRLKRVSSGHTEGRCFDFRIKDWPEDFKVKLEKRFEHLYRNCAAISKTTGLPNLIMYHDNSNGLHGHCQIKRK